MKVKEAVKAINEAKKIYAKIITRTHDGDVTIIAINKTQALGIIMGYDKDDKVNVNYLGYDAVVIG